MHSHIWPVLGLRYSAAPAGDKFTYFYGGESNVNFAPQNNWRINVVSSYPRQNHAENYKNVTRRCTRTCQLMKKLNNYFDVSDYVTRL